MSSDKKLSDIQKYKYKKMIKSLQAAKGNGTSMISLIIPAKGQISLYNKKLTDEFGTASNIKSRVNRLSVLSAITATQQRLKLYNKTPENGLVIYAGNCVTEEGKEKKLVIDIVPWEPILTTFYYCDSKFHTEPLEDILADESSYGFIIIDGKDCLFANVRGNVKTILYKFSSQIKSKSRRGGQSALRFSRLRKEQVDAHIKKAAENANRLFLESGS
jgi:peptide chain release factor subunit 1